MPDGLHFYANEFNTLDDVFDSLNDIEFETLEAATAWLVILSRWQDGRVFEVHEWDDDLGDSSGVLAFVHDGAVYTLGDANESE